MLFSEGAAAAASGESESAARETADASESDDPKEALRRRSEQLDAARKTQRETERNLKAAQDRLAELEAKDKSDVERVTAERDKLKADLDARDVRMRDMAASTALLGAATKAGARYPDLIVDRLRTKAELDDDLNVTNAEALVTAAKREYPDLFRIVDGKADGGKSDSATDTSHLRGPSRIAAAYAQRNRSG
jgi:hypothetical protein